jgi:hypothetical protein
VDLDDALRGSPAPPELLARMSLLDVEHVDLEGLVRRGQLVVHADLAEEVARIFREIRRLALPIASIVPMSAYGWDDDASMAANNTSCFNYRLIARTGERSMHSYGAAIDINPAFNPYGDDPETWQPPGATYDVHRPGTFARDAPHAGREVLELFESVGWAWLGDPDSISDRHHFEKTGFTGAV